MISLVPHYRQSEREESGRKELTRRRGAAEGLEDAFAQKDKKETKGRLECGRMVNIENHENHFADMEKREGCGCSVGARAARPWGGWKTENKRKRQCFP